MSDVEYRALISIPVYGSNDDEALEDACRAASSLFHPESRCIRGHLELLTRTDDEGREVIDEAAGFVRLNLPACLQEGSVVVIRIKDGPLPEGKEIAGLLLRDKEEG